MATNNNFHSLQLLRNGHVYANKASAKTALENATSEGGSLYNVTKKDGVTVLARYKVGAGNNLQIRTLVGYYADCSAISGETGALDSGSYMTIIDVEGAAADVDELRQEINAKLGNGVSSANTVTAQLNALSGTADDTSATTSVCGAKKYTDDKVEEELSKLDATTQSGESKVVIDVTQEDGKITTSTANLTGIKLDGYAEGTDNSGKVAATDTLGSALGKLQGQINGMDKSASVVAGQVVTTISETDGKVSETKANVKDLQLGGYAKDTSTGAIASTDTINTALSKLENSVTANKISNTDKSITVTAGTTGTDIKVNIKSGEKVIKLDGGTTGGIYTDIELGAVTPNEANVKEAWGLFTGNEQLGSTIKIYKDSSLLSVALLHATGDTKPTYDKASNQWTDIDSAQQTDANQALCFAYENVIGNTVIEAVPVGAFINEQEFASGVTWNSTQGKVIGVVDPTSEKDGANASFLTVGANGFKVSGIKDEIDRKINALDATVTGGSTSDGNHIQVVVGESDGKLTGVTVTEANIADADKLAELSGKTVTEITSTNSSITVTPANTTDNTVKYDVITDGSKIELSGYTSGTTSGSVVASDTVNQAIGKLENNIKNTINDGLQQIEAGSGITVTNVENRKQTVNVKLATNISGIEENAIKFDDNGGLYIDYLDCGTY